MGEERTIGMVFAPEENGVCAGCPANQNKICSLAKFEAENNRMPGVLEMAEETDFHHIPESCPNGYELPKGGIIS